RLAREGWRETDCAGNAGGELNGRELRGRVYALRIRRFCWLPLSGRVHDGLCVGNVGGGASHAGTLAIAGWRVRNRRALACALLSVRRRDWCVCGAAGVAGASLPLVVGWTVTRRRRTRGNAELVHLPASLPLRGRIAGDHCGVDLVHSDP